jgi:hypothetical protein
MDYLNRYIPEQNADICTKQLVQGNLQVHHALQSQKYCQRLKKSRPFWFFFDQSIIITITIIDFLYLRSLISMILDWVSFLVYPNLFGIKGFVVIGVLSDRSRFQSFVLNFRFTQFRSV